MSAELGQVWRWDGWDEVYLMVREDDTHVVALILDSSQDDRVGDLICLHKASLMWSRSSYLTRVL